MALNLFYSWATPGKTASTSYARVWIQQNTSETEMRQVRPLETRGIFHHDNETTEHF